MESAEGLDFDARLIEKALWALARLGEPLFLWNMTQLVELEIHKPNANEKLSAGVREFISEQLRTVEESLKHMSKGKSKELLETIANYVVGGETFSPENVLEDIAAMARRGELVGESKLFKRIQASANRYYYNFAAEIMAGTKEVLKELKNVDLGRENIAAVGEWIAVLELSDKRISKQIRLLKDAQAQLKAFPNPGSLIGMIRNSEKALGSYKGSLFDTEIEAKGEINKELKGLLGFLETIRPSIQNISNREASRKIVSEIDRITSLVKPSIDVKELAKLAGQIKKRNKAAI